MKNKHLATANPVLNLAKQAGQSITVFLPKHLPLWMLVFLSLGSDLHAQDYSISTTGGALVFTDISGNSETLDMSQSGADIRFVVTPTTLTYSINGGPVTAFTTPADVALGGLTSITANTAGGNDIINVAAFTASLPSLTINGGSGNETVNMNGDITFATNANLDLDLQNDDASPGTDALTVAANANLVLSGTGSATVKVSQSVTLNAGASIETVNGNLLIEANQQATPTTGAFSGVTISGGGSKLLCTGTASLTVKGRGGNSGSCKGVLVQNGGNINGGTGAVSVIGTGGNSNSFGNYGLSVIGAPSTITSAGGNVSVTGTGGGTGFGNNGVSVEVNGKITAGGTGTVTVVGNGSTAATNDSNRGVYVFASFITSSGGNVSVTGTGGGTGASSGNSGVLMEQNAIITASGSGTVTVVGNGGSSSGGGIGVVMFDFGVSITSSGGNVSVTGTGSGSSSDKSGVYVVTGARIIAGGGGTVTVVGNGSTAATGNNNYGVYVTDLSTVITSSGGNVSVTGTGGGTGTSAFNIGVYVQNGAKISHGGSGTVTVVGNGGSSSGGDNYGVAVAVSAASITSGGNVSVTGTGGGTGANNRGVSVDATGKITAGGTATVVGNGSTAATGNNNYGVFVNGASSAITSSGGNVSVTGTGGGTGTSALNNGVTVQNAATITAGFGGTVTVVGNGGSGSGGANYGVFVTTSTARITSSGGNVSVTGTSGGMGGSNHGVFVQASGQITAGGSGTVTVVGNGSTAATGSGNYGVYGTAASSAITSAGGNVSVTGTGGGTGPSSQNFGVFAEAAKISAGSSGTVTVVGNGGSGSGGLHFGVRVALSAASITSSGGNVSVTGTEGAGTTSIGIAIALNSTITTATNGGNITLIAKSMEIGSGTSVSANAAGSVTLRTPDNVQIDLGTNTVGGPLGLSDAELDLVTGGTIIIGHALAGNITVSAAITHATSNFNLTTGGDILISGGALDAGTGTVLLDCGTSPAAVKPTRSGNDVTASTLSFGSDLAIVINGTTVDVQYTQLNVVGAINLTGVDLVLSGSHLPSFGQTFLIVANDGTDAISGTFTGLAEGATISNFLGSSLDATISYIGGTGNDVLLTVTGDNIPPTALCQNVTVQLDASGNGSTTAAAVDNGSSDASGIQSLVLSQTGFDCGDVGTVQVTLTVTDNFGNTASCTADVTVEDNSEPTITCPANVTVNTDVGCGAAVSFSVAAADNCSATITQDAGLPSGSTFAVGTTVNAFTATDPSGNTASCSFTVTVNDIVPPTIICPDNMTFNSQAGVCGATVHFNMGVGDNCSATFAQNAGLPSGSTFPVGTTVNTFTAIDPSGNTASCSFTVTINDVEAPIITCPANITVNTDVGCGAAVSFSVAAADNCSATITQDAGLPSGSTFPVGTTVNSFTATDPSGNTASCSFTVTVNDIVPPTINCPGNMTFNSQADVCGATVYFNMGVGDNCSATFGQNAGLPSGSTFPVGTTVNTFTATDPSGNTASCSFPVIINDAETPTAVCQNVSTQLDASGNGSTTATAVNNGSSDACGIQSMSLSQTSFACATVGANSVTLTVTDNNGNVSTCTTDVTVEDNVAPSAICQNITVQLDASGNGSTTATAVNNGSSDACGIASMSLSQTSFACANVGANSVTLTVTDNNGNESTCAATVTVQDNVAPTAVCQNVTVQLNVSNGSVSITPVQVNNGSSDACGIQSMTLSQTAFTCSSLGANNVTLTVKDVNNNTSTCTATVSVGQYAFSASLPACQRAYFGYAPAACATINSSVSGGLAPYGYLWNTGATTSGIQYCATSPASPAPFTLTVTDANGCTVSASPAAVVNVTDVRCGNNLNKVQLCHNGNTHCISTGGVADHLAHGDYLGACGASNPCGGSLLIAGDLGLVATLEEAQVQLQWISNLNGDMEVERSTDEVSFTPVLFREGSSATKFYSGYDLNPEVGTNYYRVKQTQPDGNLAYSTVQWVVFNPESDFTVFPNPASDWVNVYMKSFLGKEVDVVIANNLGQVLYQQHIVEVTDKLLPLELNRSAFKEGLYSVSIVHLGKAHSKRLVLLRAD